MLSYRVPREPSTPRTRSGAGSSGSGWRSSPTGSWRCRPTRGPASSWSGWPTRSSRPGGTAGVWLARPATGGAGARARRRRWRPPGPRSTGRCRRARRDAAGTDRAERARSARAGCAAELRAIEPARLLPAARTARPPPRRARATLPTASARDGGRPMRWATRARHPHRPRGLRLADPPLRRPRRGVRVRRRPRRRARRRDPVRHARRRASATTATTARFETILRRYELDRPGAVADRRDRARGRPRRRPLRRPGGARPRRRRCAACRWSCDDDARPRRHRADVRRPVRVLPPRAAARPRPA